MCKRGIVSSVCPSPAEPPKKIIPESKFPYREYSAGRNHIYTRDIDLCCQIALLPGHFPVKKLSSLFLIQAELSGTSLRINFMNGKTRAINFGDIIFTFCKNSGGR